MAKAYRCDRCGAYYEANKEVVAPGMSSSIFMTGFVVTTTQDARDKRYELCDSCCQKLLDWYSMK